MNLFSRCGGREREGKAEADERMGKGCFVRKSEKDGRERHTARGEEVVERTLEKERLLVARGWSAGVEKAGANEPSFTLVG